MDVFRWSRRHRRSSRRRCVWEERATREGRARLSVTCRCSGDSLASVPSSQKCASDFPQPPKNTKNIEKWKSGCQNTLSTERRKRGRVEKWRHTCVSLDDVSGGVFGPRRVWRTMVVVWREKRGAIQKHGSARRSEVSTQLTQVMYMYIHSTPNKILRKTRKTK